MQRKLFTRFCLVLVFSFITSVFCDSSFAAAARRTIYNVSQPEGGEVAVQVWGGTELPNNDITQLLSNMRGAGGGGEHYTAGVSDSVSQAGEAPLD